MTSIESLENIAKTHGVAGVVQIAKNIVEEQKSFRIAEEEFCKLIDAAARVAHPELGARAFEKVYEHNPVLAKAIAVIKAASWLDLQPQVISGGDLRDEDDREQAMRQLAEIGRKMAPSATPERQFVLAFEDPKNAALVAKAHRRPTATTYYEFPR